MAKANVYEIENEQGDTQIIVTNSKKRALELTTLENTKSSMVELINDEPDFGFKSNGDLDLDLIYNDNPIDVIDEKTYNVHCLELAFKNYKKTELKRIYKKIDEGCNALDSLMGLDYPDIHKTFDDMRIIKQSLELVLG